MTQSRITQETLEAVVLPTPASRVTQIVGEAVVLPTPPSRITQLATEVLISDRPRSRVSQLALEVLVPNASSVDLEGVTGQLWPRAGGEYPGIGNTPTSDAGGDLEGTFPNPTVAKIRGIGVSAVSPTNGQALVYNSTTGLYEPGSGGAPPNTFEMWDPHFDPNAPNANSDEFNTAGSLPGGTYTAVNLGTSTHDVNTSMDGALVIYPQAAAGWRGWARALPAGDFTITACVTIMVPASNYTLGGIILSTTPNNSSGSSCLIYGGWNSRPTCIVEVGSNWDSAGVSAVHNWSDISSHQRVILRFRRSGTTIYSGWSFNGRTFSEASRTDSTAYAYFGPAFYNTNAVGVAVIAYEYLRYSGSATTQYGKLHTVYRQ
jgi:hypothetical protein